MKMKTTIKGLVLASLMMFGGSLNAQRFVSTTGSTVVSGFPSQEQDLSKLPKMERDIIILQNVLNDMFKESSQQRYSSLSTEIKGIHIPGKGVIFNVGDNSLSESVLFTQLNMIATGEKNTGDKKEINIDQANKEKENQLKELSKEFLLNYGSILSEVKDNEQIMLNVKYYPIDENSKQANQGENIVFLSRGTKNTKRISSSIQFKDLKDLLSGKLSFEATKGKITTKVIDNETNESSDTKIMAGILDDLFASTFDGTYRKTSNTSWTYFEGFGLMYNIGLSYNTGGNSARVAFYSGQRADVVKEEEYKKKEEEQLNKIEESFDDLIELAKESLITYGRTLRSVKSDEVIILNLNFSSFFTKNMLPKSVRISVNKSQIDQFSKGGISLDQLKKDIDVKKLTSSINSSAEGIYFVQPSSTEAQSVYDKVRVLNGKAEGKN
ncbi:hypothetical protein EV198_1147 [Roseivirga ehrenbergii]|nr:hypothetical protein EV198_1147 [Roseivirga ehrenbergii]